MQRHGGRGDAEKGVSWLVALIHRPTPAPRRGPAYALRIFTMIGLHSSANCCRSCCSCCCCLTLLMDEDIIVIVIIITLYVYLLYYYREKLRTKTGGKLLTAILGIQNHSTIKSASVQSNSETESILYFPI